VCASESCGNFHNAQSGGGGWRDISDRFRKNRIVTKGVKMKRILSSSRHHYVARVSIFLIMVAFIAGMAGCGGVTKYSLTMAVAPGGSGTASDLTNASPYTAGSGVSIKAVANSGYHFVNWTAPAGTFANANAAQTTFTMPAQNVTVTANFLPVYNLTMVANPVEGGTATDLTNTSPYTVGTGVSIKGLANSGYHFVNWTAPAGTFGNATATQTIFTMPAQNVTVTANFAIDLYFQTDVDLVLRGPATLPPEERNPCVHLGITTNIVMDTVRVDLADGRSVTRYADVLTPGGDWTNLPSFSTCVPGMPIAGGEYIFTALDAAGEPIPGVSNTDIWVGGEPPDPPTNVRAEVTKDGILVSWDESPVIPACFQPRAEPQLGFYQLMINRIETWETVYIGNCISASPHFIPEDKADFIAGKDHGLSLGEMEDGTYFLRAMALSIAPEGSLGKGLEYNSSDDTQDITFTIEDGEITIE
jgi:hypothetical protein